MIIVPSNVAAKSGVSALVTKIPIDQLGFPRYPVVNAAGTRVYASYQNFGGSYSGIAVVNTTTNAQVIVVQSGLNFNAQRMAINPAGTFLYQANIGTNNVIVYRLSDNVYTSAIATYAGASGICINPAGTKMYLAHPFSAQASTYTLPDGIPTSIATDTGAWDCACHPDGTKVYYNFGATVRVLNTSTNTFTTTITVTGGSAGGEIKVTPNGSKIYVLSDPYGTPGTVAVINTATNTVIKYITLTLSDAYTLAISPDSSTVYVAHQNATGGLTVIDVATDTISSVVSPVPNGNGCVVSPDGSTVYTANYNAIVNVSGSDKYYVGVIK